MKKLPFIILIISLSHFAAAQTDDIDSLINELLTEDEEFLSLLTRTQKYHFLYLSSSFRTATFFAGRDIEIDQFNLSNQIAYFHSSGLSLSVAGILYEEFVPQYNTTIASIGYSKEIKQIEGLRLRASFDKYFFAEVDSLGPSSFHSSLNTGLSYRFENFRVRGNFSYLIGNDPSTQMNWDLSGYLDLWKSGPSKKLRFTPSIAFLFGNETVLLNNQVEGPVQFIRNNFNQTITTTDEQYGLINTQLRLPLSLTWKNLDFEIGYNYNLPRSLGNEALSNTSFFNISVGYLINLKKFK